MARCGLGADRAGVVDLVAANREAYTTRFVLFFGAIGAHNADVGGFAALGHGSDWYEKKRICARNNFTVSVGLTVTQASDFVGARIYPFVAVGARSELAIFSSVSGVRVDGSTVEGAVVGIRVE